MKTVTLFQNLRNYEKATIVFTGLSLIFSGLTLLAVVVYAVLTYKQWQEMKRSTDAATGNFKMDERAWMGFSFCRRQSHAHAEQILPCPHGTCEHRKDARAECARRYRGGSFSEG